MANANSIRYVQLQNKNYPVVGNALTASRYCKSKDITLTEFTESLSSGDIGSMIEYFFFMIKEGCRRSNEPLTLTEDELADIVGWDEKVIELLSTVTSDYMANSVKKSYLPQKAGKKTAAEKQ